MLMPAWLLSSLSFELEDDLCKQSYKEVFLTNESPE